MALTLYNSLTRTKETFVPRDPTDVTMYACGPTVYNPPHIGNARAAVVFDLLYRVLLARYPGVRYARNITDVDDKINAAAAAEGVPIASVTARYTDVYHRDMRALNVLQPSVEPRATASIDEILAMIQHLLDLGCAYSAEGHVLFHVPSFPTYGRLSGRDRDEMIAGARVEVAPYKRDPADFVLWKPSTPELPGWPSPWGRGRPGWHIECSAMIRAHLGITIDIHGGGNDLKFPHHENELAQSSCAHHGAPLARYWVHNGFVQMDGQKMSKSLGNVLLVQDLLEQYRGETIRYALLSARYREPLLWSERTAPQAKAALDHLYGTLERLHGIDAVGDAPPAEFSAAIEDDLNTPLALAVLRQTAKEANTTSDSAQQARLKGELLAAGAELGLLQLSPEQWFATVGESAIDTARVECLIAERNAARATKDFGRADELRCLLQAMNVELQDGPGGTTTWRPTGEL